MGKKSRAIRQRREQREQLESRSELHHISRSLTSLYPQQASQLVSVYIETVNTVMASLETLYLICILHRTSPDLALGDDGGKLRGVIDIALGELADPNLPPEAVAKILVRRASGQALGTSGIEALLEAIMKAAVASGPEVLTREALSSGTADFILDPTKPIRAHMRSLGDNRSECSSTFRDMLMAYADHSDVHREFARLMLFPSRSDGAVISQLALGNADSTLPVFVPDVEKYDIELEKECVAAEDVVSPFGVPIHSGYDVYAWQSSDMAQLIDAPAQVDEGDDTQWVMDLFVSTTERKLREYGILMGTGPLEKWAIPSEIPAKDVVDRYVRIREEYGPLVDRLKAKRFGPANAALMMLEAIGATYPQTIACITSTGVSSLLYDAYAKNGPLSSLVIPLMRADMMNNVMAALIDAQLYWLPPSIVEAVISTEGLTEEDFYDIRLPFRRVCVTYGVPIRLRNDDDLWDSRIPWLYSQVDGASTAQHRILHEAKYINILGVILSSNEDGSLADNLMWLVQTEGEEGPSSVRLVLGSLSQSNLWRTVVASAAMVSWAPWGQTENDAPAVVPRTSKERRAREYNAPEDRPLSSSALQVRVPTHGAISHKEQDPDHQPSHHKRTHMRRAHWRRQRIGPRSDWTYKRTWIRHSVINPDGVPMDVVRVDLAVANGDQLITHAVHDQ